MAQTYKSQIMSWDWDGIVADTKTDATNHGPDPDPGARVAEYPDCTEGCDIEGHVGMYFIGKVYNLFPSNKFYAPWSAVSEADVDKDQRYATALEAVARAHDGWVESGEGDPTDLFFCRYWPTAPRYN
jgi:hypothetical protein